MTAHYLLVQLMWEATGGEGKQFSSSKAISEYFQHQAVVWGPFYSLDDSREGCQQSFYFLAKRH